MATIPQPSMGSNQDKEHTDLLPERIKNTTHLFSIFIWPVLMVLLLIMSSFINNFKSFADFLPGLGIIIGMAIYSAFLYFLAGGFDWKNEKLPIIRLVAFWVLGDLVIALLFYGGWYLIRYIVAKIHNIPMPVMLGRLLATRQRTYAQRTGSFLTSDGDIACEKCGLKTSLGKNYGFIQGYKNGSTTSTTYSGSTQITTKTKYYKNLTESRGVYLCNKCVSLYNARITKGRFKKAVIVVIVLLIISIPFSNILDNQLFLLPALLLVFGGPLAIVQYLILKKKEEAPLQDFSASPSLIEGEKLAIELTKTSLVKSGVNAFFTHEEAKDLKTN